MSIIIRWVAYPVVGGAILYIAQKVLKKFCNNVRKKDPSRKP